MYKVVGRLAPSPTGALHLGNARSFLLAWLSARSKGGSLLLRIEDIDSPRIKSWSVQQTIDDLIWLGLDWDYGPDIGGPDAPYTQTQRLDRYSALLCELKAREAVYPCTCSRSEIAASASAPHESLEGPIYGGSCRHRSVDDANTLNPADFAWRFRSTTAVHEWMDHVQGRQSGCVATQLGDFLVAKGDGTPAYQLAVIADDHAMSVTEVVRGCDLIASTLRQLDLLSFFGWDPPTYSHVPLMVGTDGRRLAKRHGDTRISWFREQGIHPEQLIGYLASTLGWRESGQSARAADLIPCFDPSTLPREPTTVDVPKLVATFRTQHR